MKLWHWIVVGVVIAGLFSGPGVLEAGAAAQPPIEWSDIPLVFVGGAFGMLFVIGIQLFRREPKPSKWALWLLGPLALFLCVRVERRLSDRFSWWSYAQCCFVFGGRRGRAFGCVGFMAYLSSAL